MPKKYAPKRKPLDPCPLEAVLAMVGGKWKARVLYLLAHRQFGFAALRRELGGVSQQVLSTQLRALEGDGLIFRLDEADGGSAYALSDRGRELVYILTPAAEWGTRELANRGTVWRPPLDANDAKALAVEAGLPVKHFRPELSRDEPTIRGSERKRQVRI